MKEVLNGEYVRINCKNYEIYCHTDKKTQKDIQVILVNPEDKNIRIKSCYEINDGKVVIPIDLLEIESAFYCRSYCTYNNLKDCIIRNERYQGKDVIMVLPPMDVNKDEEKYGFDKIKIGPFPQDYMYMKIIGEDEIQDLRYEKKPIEGLPFNEED